MFAMAGGVASLDFHGVADYPPGNVGGKLEYYSPIVDTGTPTPEYYRLLLYREITRAGGVVTKVTTSGARDLDANDDLDITSTEQLDKLVDSLGAQQVALAIAHLHQPAEQMARAAGLLAKVSGDHVFPTLADAVAWASGSGTHAASASALKGPPPDGDEPDEPSSTM